MSPYPLPPNPCLVAVLLIVRTTSDPYIVFHYPPRPGQDNSRFKNLFKDNALEDESTSSSSGDESTESATEATKLQSESEVDGNKDSLPDGDGFGSASPDKSDPLQPEHKWDDLFGFQASILAKLLTPAITGHKQRFEVGLGDKVMLGRPVFAGSDGTWKSVKKHRRSSSRSNVTGEKANKYRGDLKKTRAKRRDVEDQDSTRDSTQEASIEDQSDPHEETQTLKNESESNPTVQKNEDLTPKKDSKIVFSKAAKKPLVMFHVVHVLQPPPLEYHIRVGEMYNHIVRKFSKALKWEQSRSNYVASEVALISSVRKAARRMSSEEPPLGKIYHDLIAQSSLARAIATLYNSVSNLRIAHLSLTPSLSLSLKIPIPTSISMLPTPLSPQLPGLWLTTADSMPRDDDVQTTGTQLGSHFTLLLLADLNSILSDVNAGSSPFADALTDYLRVSKPTKSFYQISQSSGISLSDIQQLAYHLIYWRRARAIPPLHQRDTYIVSPNADMRKLSAAASTFSKVFPTLPSLPYILSILSSRIRPYSNMIPSKDHKEAYMEILAWLMRGGWVTQLRTFAWVRIPGHIKESVEKQKPSGGSERSPGSSVKDGTEDSTDESDHASSSHLDVPHTYSRSASPSSSTHTTLPFPQPSHHSPSLLPNPSLASDLPSRHLHAISNLILETQGKESQSAWTKSLKYFDGRHALETIPVREGWKRKKAKEWLDGWVELGVLVKGRHW